jgi:hypothetical protein
MLCDADTNAVITQWGLQQIDQAGDRGIWVRDIKLSTGIQQQTITKALKV